MLRSCWLWLSKFGSLPGLVPQLLPFHLHKHGAQVQQVAYLQQTEAMFIMLWVCNPYKDAQNKPAWRDMTWATRT